MLSRLSFFHCRSEAAPPIRSDSHLSFCVAPPEPVLVPSELRGISETDQNTRNNKSDGNFVFYYEIDSELSSCPEVSICSHLRSNHCEGAADKMAVLADLTLFHVSIPALRGSQPAWCQSRHALSLFRLYERIIAPQPPCSPQSAACY